MAPALIACEWPWRVHKFGGTSIGKPESLLQVVGIIASLAGDSSAGRPAVVLSAISPEKKGQGTTSMYILRIRKPRADRSARLLELVRSIVDADSKAARQSCIDSLLEHHLGLIRATFQGQQAAKHAASMVEEQVSRLGCFIDALEGIHAQAVVLDDVVRFKQLVGSACLDQAFYDAIALQLSATLKEMPANCVPVVTGFFGPVPGSLLQSIGRGYTDLCAALLAVGLSASELVVWKEVDGAYSADPFKVPSARLLSEITPEEAIELTYYGAEFIHPFTMGQAMHGKVPIRIASPMKPARLGTLIRPSPEAAPHNPSMADGTPTAVTVKEGVIVISVTSHMNQASHLFFANVFGMLDKYSTVVDLISTSRVSISMALSRPAADLLATLRAVLSTLGRVVVSEKQAIVSIVGRRMRHCVGMSGRIFSALGKASVNIEMISQGASEINISCVIAEKDCLAALRAVHAEVLDQ